MSNVARVFLRDGTSAAITGTCDVPGFPLVGYRGQGSLELWTKDGRYREDGSHHPLDVTAIEHGGVIVPFLGLHT